MTAFFDTNVLVYAFLDPEKRPQAIETLARGGVISAQVLNEFTNVARNKRQREWREIEAAVILIRERIPDVVPLTVDTHAAALILARDHSFAFYDALIVAAAIEAGCDTLYSEDMQHGRVIGGLTIRNPFRESPA
ncbi:MAG: PIN domain-containing protein [Alphaproteobacteria bacterium]|nr:PIN domain-containing protein [Alphaproteobacteria bacterium]